MASKRAYPAPMTAWRTLTLSIPLNGNPFGFTLRASVKTATDDGDKLSGHRYCSTHLQQVSMKNHCPECGVCDTITGYEHGETVVTMPDSEVHALMPADENAATLTAMVDASEVDPLLIEKTYLVWWGDDSSAKNFALLAGALRASGKWLVGSGTVGNAHTKPFALRYSEVAGALVAHTLLHDVRVRWGMLTAVGDSTAGLGEQLGLDDTHYGGAALLLSDALDDSINLSTIADTYNDDLRAAVEAKAAGVEAPEKAKAPVPAAVPDLMDSLRASVEANKGTKAPKLGRRGVEVDVGTPDEAVARAKRTPKREKVA